MEFRTIVEAVTRTIETAGIFIVAIGAVSATAWFVHRLRIGVPFSIAYGAYRQRLGQAILLGLEFLVAADIIGTVTISPTFTSMGMLAAIVLIRTFLSTALAVEIEGRWPWQRGEAVPYQ
jgi:uncharacterized membrane protein